MVEDITEKSRIGILALIIVSLIGAFVIIGMHDLAEVSFSYIEHCLTILFEYGILGLYVIGVSIVLFGSILMTSRYIRIKAKSPLEPVRIMFHASYLTLGLEILIAAEVIKTVLSRTFDDFLSLILTIAIRFIIALVLFFERKAERNLGAAPHSQL